MVDRGDVVWAPDPFKPQTGTPRPWLVIAVDRLPYPQDESIAVAFTTSSHHPGSFRVPSESWALGEPGQRSFVLPWTIATLKNDIHVVGQQGSVSEEFVDSVTEATISVLTSDDKNGSVA